MKFDGKHYIAHRQWDVTQQFVRADRAGIPAATWEPSSELSGMVYHKIPYEIPQVCTYIYIHDYTCIYWYEIYNHSIPCGDTIYLYSHSIFS